MPSRRKLIELDADEIRDYLDAQKTLIIVGNGPNGYPHAMPMWFAHDPDGTIRCTTFGKSQKVLNWRRDPKIYADCEIIDDLDAVKDTLVSINSRGRDLDNEMKDKLREAVSGTAAKRVVLKFTPKRYVTWDHAKLGGRY